MRELTSNKTTTFGYTPKKIYKKINCSNALQKFFHDALKDGYFPDKLECADVTPAFKKDDPIKE